MSSLWYMLHLILTWAIVLELASRVVFHNPIEFLTKPLSVLLILDASSIQVSMYVALSHRFSCSQSRQCTGQSFWCYSL